MNPIPRHLREKVTPFSISDGSVALEFLAVEVLKRYGAKLVQLPDAQFLVCEDASGKYRITFATRPCGRRALVAQTIPASEQGKVHTIALGSLLTRWGIPKADKCFARDLAKGDLQRHQG